MRAHDLPYGQQKIVGFARAMAADPKLLLLDEPGSGLTRDEKEDLARFILRLRFDWKVSILWIEHDLQMVSDLADRVHVLNLGECIASGTPDEVKRVPAVINAYVGDEPIAARKPSIVAAPLKAPGITAIAIEAAPPGDSWGPAVAAINWRKNRAMTARAAASSMRPPTAATLPDNRDLVVVVGARALRHRRQPDMPGAARGAERADDMALQRRGDCGGSRSDSRTFGVKSPAHRAGAERHISAIGVRAGRIEFVATGNAKRIDRDGRRANGPVLRPDRAPLFRRLHGRNVAHVRLSGIDHGRITDAVDLALRTRGVPALLQILQTAEIDRFVDRGLVVSRIVEPAARRPVGKCIGWDEIAANNVERVAPKLHRDPVHHPFERKMNLRRAEAAHRAGRRLVGHHDVDLLLHGRDGIGACAEGV